MTYRSPQHAPIVAIVILNWNGWRDTLQCLESVYALDYAAFQVIVCDNGSTDGSLDRIREWAKAQTKTLTEFRLPDISTGPGTMLGQLALIDTGANLGFAGGSNVGCRLAISLQRFDYIWLLNNDTVVTKDALAALVEKMDARPDAGVCGSRLVYHHTPDKLQAAGGGTYNRWLARTSHIAALESSKMAIDEDWVERTMDYVIGASMLVRTSLFKQIGLLEERYFLYFEEIDLACRMRGIATLAYAHQSIVHHKEGGSINKSSRVRSRLADRLSLINRLKFTRQFYPYALPTVYAAIVATLGKYAVQGNWERLGYLVRLLAETSIREVPPLEPTSGIVQKQTSPFKQNPP